MLQILAWVIIRSILILSVSILNYPLYCWCWVCGREHNNRYLEIPTDTKLALPRAPGRAVGVWRDAAAGKQRDRGTVRFRCHGALVRGPAVNRGTGGQF